MTLDLTTLSIVAAANAIGHSNWLPMRSISSGYGVDGTRFITILLHPG